MKKPPHRRPKYDIGTVVWINSIETGKVVEIFKTYDRDNPSGFDRYKVKKIRRTLIDCKACGFGTGRGVVCHLCGGVYREDMIEPMTVDEIHVHIQYDQLDQKILEGPQKPARKIKVAYPRGT